MTPSWRFEIGRFERALPGEVIGELTNVGR